MELTSGYGIIPWMDILEFMLRFFDHSEINLPLMLQ